MLQPLASGLDTSACSRDGTIPTIPTPPPPAATSQHEPPAQLSGVCMALPAAQHFPVRACSSPSAARPVPLSVCATGRTDPSVRPGEGRQWWRALGWGSETGSRGVYGRSGFASFFKSSAPSATRPETQPLLPASRRPSPPGRDTYGTSSLSSSSNSGSCKGSDSSPTPRRSSKYNLCSDNHGIKPPTPEQYLTPLQQKEVCIRHLKARLKDTQERLQDRDAEIEDLKTQLSRMQEDWIEEECHRVEAQLALKEARKEIKQLKQVIDTVKNNLLEKDKGLQKYFVDINIQNKKLETLLHSMEVAQNGALKDEGAGESAGGSPARSLTRSSTYTKLSDQGAGDRNVGGSQTISLDEGADSSFVGMEEAPGHTDPLEVGGEPGTRLPPSNTYEKVLGLRSSAEAGVQASCMQERAIQTDFVPCQPDLDTILEKVMKSQACSLGSPTSAWVSEMEDTMPVPELANPTGTTDLMVAEPDAATAAAGAEGGVPCNPAVRQPPSASPSVAIACVAEEELTEVTGCETSPSKSYWSRHFIVDLLAVVVPAVPTVAWLCRSQRRQGQPIYNISSLLRGCCTVALHSIRRMGCRPVASPGPGGTAQP
ncbi:syntaphilin isoform X2 [Corvus cornix cornix]|uniref:syntaphilin isoform X2 n=1 Tax=Corvus cornix cornix TaxID=932674 RepID=UPI00194EF19C|nr:syntaphilin isoform X2 [Corvus cornix cornix]XP_041903740.1 syntaphilin isoform X1 [Corvus kubaryi]XP_048177576.1 syntaphilin isoform X1 [Corvus hawaiiensis]